VLGGKAAIYARSATDKQNRDPIADQVGKCVRYAVDNNLPINPVDVYCDMASSGSNLQRPGFQALLKDIRQEKAVFRHLIVVDPSRISRNTQDLLHLIQELRGYGISVHWVRG
jgi:site-specific DNA recombinase